jgi:hypothetical protein
MTAVKADPRISFVARISNRVLSPVQRALLGGLMSLSVAILDRRMRKLLQRR